MRKAPSLVKPETTTTHGFLTYFILVRLYSIHRASVKDYSLIAWCTTLYRVWVD